MGRERDFYTNVIILLLTLIFVRLLGQMHQKEAEKEVIFHLINWELKGTHSTDAFYARLEDDLVVPGKIQGFIEGRITQQLDLQHSNSFRDMQHSNSFRDMQHSNSFRDLQGSTHLVKVRQSTNGFSLALNKENQKTLNKMLPTTLSFRKAPSQPSVRGAGKGNGKKPSVFEGISVIKVKGQ